MKLFNIVKMIKESEFDDIHDSRKYGSLRSHKDDADDQKKDLAKRVTKWISDNPNWKKDRVEIQKWTRSWPEEGILHYVLHLIESGKLNNKDEALEYNNFLNGFLRFEEEDSREYIGHEDFDEDIARMVDQGNIDEKIISKIPDSAFARRPRPTEEMPIKNMSMAKWYLDHDKIKGTGSRYRYPESAIQRKKKDP